MQKGRVTDQELIQFLGRIYDTLADIQEQAEESRINAHEPEQPGMSIAEELEITQPYHSAASALSALLPRSTYQPYVR